MHGVRYEPDHAHRLSSISTCRRSASRCGRRRRAMPRGCWWCGRARRRRLEDRIVRDLPDLLRAGDALVVNDTKVIPARLSGRRIGRGEEPQIEATLHKRLDGSRWRAFVKPAKRLAAGDVVRFGDEGKVCFLGQLDATVEAQGRGRRGDACRSRFTARCSTRRSPSAATMPLPPYIAGKRTADERGPRRLPDHVRARGGLGRGADRRPAFHPDADRRGSQARGVALHTRDAACRRRHLPAGEGRRHRRPQDACRMGRRSTRRPPRRSTTRAPRAAASCAVGTTSLRLLESAADEDGSIRPFRRRDRRSSSRPAIASAPSTCC